MFQWKSVMWKKLSSGSLRRVIRAWMLFSYELKRINKKACFFSRQLLISGLKLIWQLCKVSRVWLFSCFFTRLHREEKQSFYQNLLPLSLPFLIYTTDRPTKHAAALVQQPTSLYAWVWKCCWRKCSLNNPMAFEDFHIVRWGEWKVSFNSHQSFNTYEHIFKKSIFQYSP